MAVAAALAGCGTSSTAARPTAATSHLATKGPATKGPATGGTATGAAAAVPRPRHIVVVMEENHSYQEITGSSQARYLHFLARHGALFTQSHAVAHPSEPNYLALFSGSTHGVTSDACPLSFGGPNLGADLIAAKLSFAGYSEDLPATGSPACVSGEYARKHVPWTNFRNVPRSDSRPLSGFPENLARLPTVSFVIPDLCHDMHDCSVGTGDTWLRTHLHRYAAWALKHDSLLIVTWDEDDGTVVNHIPTIFYGPMVAPGRYAQRITHYRVLRTIEAAYGLRRDGRAAAAAPITGVWKR